MLQRDTLNDRHARTNEIVSIRHLCKDKDDSGHTIWFNDDHTITQCYCKAQVPEVIQGLCILFNMDWLQRQHND